MRRPARENFLSPAERASPRKFSKSELEAAVYMYTRGSVPVDARPPPTLCHLAPPLQVRPPTDARAPATSRNSSKSGRGAVSPGILRGDNSNFASPTGRPTARRSRPPMAPSTASPVTLAHSRPPAHRATRALHPPPATRRASRLSAQPSARSPGRPPTERASPGPAPHLENFCERRSEQTFPPLWRKKARRAPSAQSPKTPVRFTRVAHSPEAPRTSDERTARR